MNNLSVSVQVSREKIQRKGYQVLGKQKVGSHNIRLLHLPNEILLEVDLNNSKLLFVRLLHLNTILFEPSVSKTENHNYEIEVATPVGEYFVHVSVRAEPFLHVQFKQVFRPAKPTVAYESVPDVFILDAEGYKFPKKGKIYLSQHQLRSAQCYFDLGINEGGNMLYFQDLGYLNDYAEAINASLSDCVKVRWPELGLVLPFSEFEPLNPDKDYVLNNGHVILDPAISKTAIEASQSYTRLLFEIYQYLKKPELTVKPIVTYASRSLRDLSRNHGCWQQIQKYGYLNAYYNGYGTPAESMVQMTVIDPLIRYTERFKSQNAKHIIEGLLAGFGEFYEEKIGCFGRWIRGRVQHLDGEEEQKKPRVMDSWYLFHPLIHLANVLRKNADDEELSSRFYSSVDFCIKVAKHFDYKWPIFYDIDSLDIIKGESKPGAGGEKDVPGLYAFLMLRAFELSEKNVYLQEAKRAAKSLFEYGFDLIYQSNNTTYAAEALLKLWTITKESKYLLYSELCWGNIVRNCGIWNRTYGNSKEYPTFFTLFPLSDAKYSAIFEEHEVLASIRRFMVLADQSKAPLSVELMAMLAEYSKYCGARIPYYFPPLLPTDVLTTDPKSGYLNSKIWLPVEDLGDGWDAIGQVGQEVYGAGALVQLVNVQTLDLLRPGEILWINYPFFELKRKKNMIRLKILGSDVLQCRMHGFGLGTSKYQIESTQGMRFEMSDRSKTINIHAGQEITIKI